LLFERNQAKDFEDTVKNPTVGNNYTIEIYYKNSTKNNINMLSHPQDKPLMAGS